MSLIWILIGGAFGRREMHCYDQKQFFYDEDTPVWQQHLVGNL